MSKLKLRSLVPWLLAAGFALLFLGSLVLSQQKDNTPPLGSASLEPQQESEKDSLVARVIDGDTVELEDGTRVRYIGVDTPEPGQCFGSLATEANVDLVANRQVRLETDIEKQDRYGRSLAYVFIGSTLINEELVRQGFATVTTYAPNVKYVERFLSAQREAREQARGLWAEGACSSLGAQTSLEPSLGSTSQTDCVIKGNISSSGEKIYHMLGQRYYNQTKIEENKGERWLCSEDEAVSAGWRKSKV